MTRWYIDTSAAIKVLVDEPESTALSRTLDREGPDLGACWLLVTELRRAVLRIPGLTHEAVTSLVDALSLYTVPPPVFNEAGLLPGTGLRSLDAVHLAAALRMRADRMLTYDDRLAAACRGVGLPTVSPGRG